MNEAIGSGIATYPVRHLLERATRSTLDPLFRPHTLNCDEAPALLQERKDVEGRADQRVLHPRADFHLPLLPGRWLPPYVKTR